MNGPNFITKIGNLQMLQDISGAQTILRGVGLPFGRVKTQRRYEGFLGIGCPAIYNITADTTPDLDRWGPDCYWEGKDWVKWYNAVKQKYGKAEADNRFSNEWGKRGAFGHELWIANNDKAFREMVVAEGLNQTVPDLKLIGITGGAVDKVVQTGGNVINSAGNVISDVATGIEKGTGSLGDIITWLPWIALGAAALIGFLWIRKNYAA